MECKACDNPRADCREMECGNGLGGKGRPLGQWMPQPAPHEAYAALRTALIGSGVLTMAEAEQSRP